MKRLILFDFDGTITYKDSLVDFIQYAVGKPAYYLGLLKLSPTLVSYLLKITPNDRAKEKMIQYFFANWDQEEFKTKARNYSVQKINQIVREEAKKKLAWHKQRGDEIVVVSASIRCWLEEWCKQNEIQLIATELEIQNNKLTGKFKTPNCYSEEKVKRVKKIYNLNNYDYICAYGDSSGDKALLAIADEQHYKPFQ